MMVETPDETRGTMAKLKLRPEAHAAGEPAQWYTLGATSDV